MLFTQAASHVSDIDHDADNDADSSDVVEIDLVAGQEVGVLGFRPSDLPPNPVFVEVVHRMTWAFQNGLQVGDELVEVNGVPVEAYTETNFKLALQSRPVHLKFISCWLDEEEEEEEEGDEEEEREPS